MCSAATAAAAATAPAAAPAARRSCNLAAALLGRGVRASVVRAQGLGEGLAAFVAVRLRFAGVHQTDGAVPPDLQLLDAPEAGDEPR